MAIFVPDGATVLKSLNDVVVPAGTPPGSSFTVYITAKPKDGRPRCKATELWAASGSMPAQQSQAATIVTGWRYKHRPSMRAKEAGGTHAKAIDHYESIQYTAAAWSTNEPAPFELKEEDTGWLPGPVGGDAGRSRPRFQHAGPHCRLPRITKHSSARKVMKELCWFQARAAYVLEKTKAKAAALLAGKTKLDGVDRAWRASDTTVDHLELHLVAKIRIARLNPAINSGCLWDESHDLFDSKLSAALPHDCYRWLNRYMSFGDYGADVDGDTTDSDEEDPQEDSAAQAYDRYRKGRGASDLVRRQAGKVFCCGQDVVWDDFVRVTRHLEGSRQRHKAALHTGCPGEGLACCRSNYIVSWEERGWVQDEAQRATGSSGATNGAGGSRDTVSGTGGGAPARLRAAQQQSGARGRGTGAGRSGASRGRGGGCGGGRGGRGSGAAVADSDASADESDEAAGSADESDDGGAASGGVNSTHARFERAAKSLQANVGHCVWFDNGLGTMKLLQTTAQLGHGATAMMNPSRVGIPRRLIALIRKRVRCPKGCTHTPDSEACTRFRWFVMHKGPWELAIWFDIGNQAKGKGCVISVSDCTSCTRINTLARTVSRHTMLVPAPEPIGLYNVFGRHGLDVADQHRKRLSLAHRRLLRQGPKRHLHDSELVLCNGTALVNTKRDTPATVWDFANEYCNDVLSAVSMRRRSSGVISAATAQETTAATRAALESHVPINFQAQARRARRAGDANPPKRKRGRRCCEAPACEPGEAKRPTLFCAGCKHERDSCSGWYCEPCFWKRHKCSLKVD